MIQRLKQFGIDDIEIINAVNFISYQRLIPTNKDVELFLDYLESPAIEDFLKSETIDNKWQELLENAYQRGYLDEETYQEYLY